MEILFLYQRLHHTAEKQLKSLKALDFGTLEMLTKERESITRYICENVKNYDIGGESMLPQPVRKKIHEITTQILDIDRKIKDLLLEELSERTLELSNFTKDPD